MPWNQARHLQPVDIEQGISTLTDTRVVLAACRDNESSFEEGKLGHGLFTYHMIEGLTGDATNFKGEVTVGSLYEYVRTKFESAVKQQPLLRGDVGGRVVIGAGFTPRIGPPVPQAVRESLVAEGRQLLDEYGDLATRVQGHWNQSGHLECSQSLTAIARWYDTQLSNHPELANDGSFGDLRQALRGRISQLGSVEKGVRTVRGVLAAKIGSGGFGTVWRVDSEDHGTTAMKVFHPAGFGERDKLDLFYRGYRAMARLDHPRVVSVYEYTTAPIGFYMDFIDGPNLRQLPELLSDPAEVLRILILTAETIQHAHGRGVIHRDIKPENILLSFDQVSGTWWPHLTDFDLAWFSTATSIDEKSFGNLYFAAPEQLAKPRSNAARSPAVDIFAFGQLLFFSLTGSDPTPFATEQNIAVLKDRITSWSSGSAAFKVVDWYSRATAEDPDVRLPDFHTAISELAEAEVYARTDAATTQLTNYEVLQEVAFGLSGFAVPNVVEGQSIRSVSGQTEMEFRLADTVVAGGESSLQLAAILRLDSLEVPGVSSDRAKAIYLSRVNAVVGSLQDVSRKSRSDGAFSVEVTFSNLERKYSSVLYVRQVLGKVVDGLER